MGTLDVIKEACYRSGGDWKGKTSEELAAAVEQPATLKPLTLIECFQQATAAGADVSEFTQVWSYEDWLRRLESSLQDGDLVDVSTLLAIKPATFTEATEAAISAVITANTWRLVDVVAADLGEYAPANVTAADVDEALGRY